MKCANNPGDDRASDSEKWRSSLSVLPIFDEDHWTKHPANTQGTQASRASSNLCHCRRAALRRGAEQLWPRNVRLHFARPTSLQSGVDIISLETSVRITTPFTFASTSHYGWQHSFHHLGIGAAMSIPPAQDISILLRLEVFAERPGNNARKLTKSISPATSPNFQI